MDEILVFGGGFLAAFIGSMSGGGAGFISFGVLLYLGLPPKAAIATNAFGDAGFFPVALRNFNNAGQLKKKALPEIVIISVLGGIIGTSLIIYIDESIFNILLAAIMILVVAVVFANRHDPPINERKPKKYWSAAYMGASIAGGVSSAGTGILSSLSLLYMRGLTPLQSLANSFYANAVSAFFSLGMLIVFTDLIDFRLGSIMFVGNMAGAHLGSRLAIKKGNKFVHYMIMAVAVLVVIQLILKS